MGSKSKRAPGGARPGGKGKAGDKTVRVTCAGTSEAPPRSLEWFQGSLKEISPESMGKLKASIARYGFSFPVFAWRGKIISGHHRVKALLELGEEGWRIPARIPVCEIEAADEREAAEKVLVESSRYAEVTKAGLLSFVEAFGIGEGALGDLRIPEVQIDRVFLEATPPDEFRAVGEDIAVNMRCPKCGYEWSR